MDKTKRNADIYMKYMYEMSGDEPSEKMEYCFGMFIELSTYKTFILITDQMNWDAAQNVCRRDNGSLACISDELETQTA